MLLRAIITVSILVVCAYDVARAADRGADAPVSVTETTAEAMVGKDALAPPMPSVSVGYSFFPYRTLERAGR